MARTSPERVAHDEAPPAGEQVHLPGPSLVPLVNAIAVSLAVIGLATTLLVTWFGLILFVVSTVGWVRDTRRDISHLPAEQ